MLLRIFHTALSPTNFGCLLGSNESKLQNCLLPDSLTIAKYQTTLLWKIVFLLCFQRIVPENGTFLVDAELYRWIHLYRPSSLAPPSSVKTWSYAIIIITWLRSRDIRVLIVSRDSTSILCFESRVYCVSTRLWLQLAAKVFNSIIFIS